MANKITKSKQRPAPAHRPPPAESVRAIAEALAALVPETHAAAWDWIVYHAWARSPEHARRIAEREGIRLTKIGRDLYGHRADLDALATRNVVVTASNDSGEEDLDPEVAAAFAGGSR